HESREPNAKRERGQGQEGKPRAHGADHRVIDGKEVRQRFVHHVNAERDAQGYPGGAEMDHAVPHRTPVATITPMNRSNAQSTIVAARLPFFISCTKSMCGKCHQDTAHKVETERASRSEEHTSELQSLAYLVCRLLLEKKKRHIYLIVIMSFDVEYNNYNIVLCQ